MGSTGQGPWRLLHGRRGELAGMGLALGLAGYLALHFFEPSASITWSFAHLGRHPALPVLGLALLVSLPMLSVWAWRRPTCGAELQPLRPAYIVGAALLAFGVLAAAGLGLPAPGISLDVLAFASKIEEGVSVGRWHLMLWSYQRGAGLLAPLVPTRTAILLMNSLAASIALMAVAASARLLARTRGEAVAMVLLCWSAYGILQLGVGYADIYPFALAWTAILVWLGLRTLRGAHPAPLFAVGALGPFCYFALALWIPALVVPAAFTLRREHGARQLASALFVAVLCAGAATIPVFGRPFAWSAFLTSVGRSSASQFGLVKGSSLLPASVMFSGGHLEELGHTFLLVDGVGWLLLLGPGVWLLTRIRRRPERADVAFLGSMVAFYVAYAFMMDPVYGAYFDWDLWSYGAVATSLLGALSFVAWGRSHPRFFPALLGVALAAAGVHLLARLDAIDVDRDLHLKQSPYHVTPAQARFLERLTHRDSR